MQEMTTFLAAVDNLFRKVGLKYKSVKLDSGERKGDAPRREETAGRSGSLIEFFRSARWLNPRRARGWCRMLGTVLGVCVLTYVALSTGGIGIDGKPLGTDFVSFYAASKLALAGHPEQAYNVQSHLEAQTQIFNRSIGYGFFFYPPIYLLFCLPLALLPYGLSLALWLGTTLLAYWRVVRAFLGTTGLTEAILAFPAVLLTLGHGQNAFLSTGLFGGAILAQTRWPALSGVLFGALAFKPQLGIVIPFALIATRRWNIFFAASVTVVALIALTVALFGADTWRSFLDGSALAGMVLEQGVVEPYKMVSAYAGIRVLGGGSTFAFIVQGVVSLCAISAMTLTLRSRKRADEDNNPLMVVSALLASPFLLDYDLTLLALPMAWLHREATRTRFLPYEKITLFAAFVLPLVSRLIGLVAHAPIGPLVIALLFLVIARRMLKPDLHAV